MLRFWFVRHGQSVHNAAGLFCGSIDSPLTDAGRAQAEHTASFFTDVTCDWLVTSPQQRAYDTAAIIATRHNLSVRIDERLREHAKGDLEDTPHVAVKSHAWRNVPGAESMASLHERTLQALRELSSRAGTGIVVAHAGVARAIQSIHDGTPPDELYDLKKVGNAQPYLVELSPAHLGLLPGDRR
jgi:broad specificity phosphatase PhoE